jgi:hypothetical protein
MVMERGELPAPARGVVAVHRRQRVHREHPQRLSSHRELRVEHRHAIEVHDPGALDGVTRQDRDAERVLARDQVAVRVEEPEAPALELRDPLGRDLLQDEDVSVGVEELARQDGRLVVDVEEVRGDHA